MVTETRETMNEAGFEVVDRLPTRSGYGKPAQIVQAFIASGVRYARLVPNGKPYRTQAAGIRRAVLRNGYPVQVIERHSGVYLARMDADESEV